MKPILYFAVTRLQERYYKYLSVNLGCPGRVVHHSRLREIGWFCPDESVRVAINEGVEADMAVARAKKRPWGSGWMGTLYGLILQCRGRILAYRYESLLERERPAVIALWNNRKTRQILMAALAKRRHIRPVYFENGLLPDTTTLDWSGVNYDNSLPRDGEFYRRYGGDVSSLPSKLVSRESEMGKAALAEGCTLPEKFIFVPFQVDYDSQIISHSPWIRNMEHLVRVIVKAAEGASFSVVFKEHPSSEVSYEALRRESESSVVRFASDCPTQELIERALAVVTINSTVGLESLLLGKNIVVLGNAFYAIPGLVRVAASDEELYEVFNELEKWEPDETLRRGFLNYLWNEYLIPRSWRTPDANHIRAINQRLECPQKRNEIYLVSTVLNLYNATLLALDRASQADPHLIFIDQTAEQAAANETMISGWALNPFASVSSVVTRGHRRSGKIGERKKELAKLADSVRALRPAMIVTGNDRRIEFLYAMHCAARENEVLGAYMDDGLYSYVEHTKPWWQEGIFHRIAGMVAYGAWYRRYRTVGASPLIGRAYLAFPDQACDAIRSKELSPLPLHRAKEAEVAALSHTMLENAIQEMPALAGLDVVMVLPHESLLRKDPALRVRIESLLGQFSETGKQVGIKNHPRNAPELLHSLAKTVSLVELPPSVAFEALLPLLGEPVVIGAASTVLLSCRWLRPDIAVYYLDTDPKTVELYEKLGVTAYPQNEEKGWR